MLDFLSQDDYPTGRETGVTVFTSDKVAMMDLMNGVPEGINVVYQDEISSRIGLLLMIVFVNASISIYYLKIIRNRYPNKII